MPSKCCVILLSEKSSGSSILQNELCKHPSINHIVTTEHYEHETLFWLKAACLVEDNKSLFFNDTPKFSAEDARQKLINLIVGNVPSFDAAQINDLDLIQLGWEALSDRYSPVFFEKSPHHLQNWASLKLMLDSLVELKQQYFIIFLVRHPMAMLLSAWERWRSNPLQRQWGWYTSYSNMFRFSEMLDPNHYMIIKYEDLVDSPHEYLTRICERLDLDLIKPMGDSVHRESQEGWRSKKITFDEGWQKIWKPRRPIDQLFKLDPKVEELARRLEYEL